MSLTSVSERQNTRRAANRLKLGTRAPVYHMACRYHKLIRELGSAGRKGKGRKVLQLKILSMAESQWTSNVLAAPFKPLMFELARWLQFERWAELRLQVSIVSVGKQKSAVCTFAITCTTTHTLKSLPDGHVCSDFTCSSYKCLYVGLLVSYDYFLNVLGVCRSLCSTTTENTSMHYQHTIRHSWL